MSRNVVCVVVAFAALVGGSMLLTDSSAQAGQCGGGLFAKLKAARTSCCEPAPAPVVECCPPVEQSCGGGLFAKLRAKLAARKSSCCEPEPVCCEPAPAPCCEPAPAPCCGSAPAPAPCCGGSSEVVYGETVISEAPVASASDDVPPAPVPATE
jgi:hypothetical protein